MKIVYYIASAAYGAFAGLLVVGALEYVAINHALPALAWLLLWGVGFCSLITLWKVWELMTYPWLDSILRAEVRRELEAFNTFQNNNDPF